MTDIGTLIGQRILSLCRAEGISLNKLGMICRITQSTLNNIVHGGSKNPTVQTVARICRGLGIDLKTFFDDPSFDQPVRRRQ
ncbi:MAG: helix-turn-helix domain-containing protein [Clostridiales bacterium]|nr:helix-turn-helix domain-containing protein [Clostridiales bacterium]